MNDSQLLEEIILLYRKARDVKQKGKNIFRGRSHGISSEVEDLFAYYLSENIDYENLYIDQPISFKIKDTSKTYYPDIIVQKENIFTNFLDLKMDLGWNRNGLGDFCKNLDNRIEDIKGKTGIIKNGKTKETQSYKISQKVKYIIVVVSAANNKKGRIDEQISQIEKECKNVEVCVLSLGLHPNTYNAEYKDVLENIGINKKDFIKLKELLI